MEDPKRIKKNPFDQKVEYGWENNFSSQKEREDFLKQSTTLFRRQLNGQSKPNYKNGSLKAILSIAAGVLVVVCALSWVFWTGEEYTGGPLFKDYYEKLPYAKTGIVRGADESAAYAEQPKLQAAIQAYRNNDFKKAIQLFENHLLIHPEDAENRLYFALSMIEYNPARAARELKQVSEVALSAEIKETAIWYRALALLKDKNLDKACLVLRSYTSPMSDFLQKRRVSFLAKCGHNH